MTADIRKAFEDLCKSARRGADSGDWGSWNADDWKELVAAKKALESLTAPALGPGVESFVPCVCGVTETDHDNGSALIELDGSNDGLWRVLCHACGMNTGWHASESDALAVWNHATPNPEQPVFQVDSITRDFEKRLLPHFNSTVYGKDETEALLEYARALESLLTAQPRGERTEAEHQLDLAFQQLEIYGVSRKRAETVWNGIEVLATRHRRALASAQMKGATNEPV